MSRYQTLPLQIIGGDYKSRSTAWNSQSMVNLYIDSQKSGRTAQALMPWPGEKFHSRATAVDGSGSCRGIHAFKNTVFCLFGRQLIEFYSNKGFVIRGEVPGDQRVYMFDDGINIFMRLDGTGTFINKKIVLQGNGDTYYWDTDEKQLKVLTVPRMQGDEFVYSDPGQSTSFLDSSVQAANLDSDDLVQMFTFQQKLIGLGKKSIQFFYDDIGTKTATIFSLLQQASTTSVGVTSRFSGAETPGYFYFLGSDDVVYRISSYLAEPVSNSSIVKELASVETGDAIGMTVQIEGQWFYILQLPSADATIAYSEQTGEWLRLSSGVGDGFPRHIVAGVVNIWGGNYIAHTSNGGLYRWDPDWYLGAANVPIIRQFDTAPVNAIALGNPGRRLFANKVILIMETGVGSNLTRDPQIMFSHSIDGGRSFTNEDWVSFGRSGNGGQIVEYYMRESFYDLILRVRVSDPNFTSFHAASIDVKDGGI